MHKPHPFAHFALGCVISLMALLGSSSSVAQENFGEKTVRLSSFTMEDGPIRLDGTSENIDIYIPLSTTAVISNTWLDLQFIHSVLLLGERSSIRVLFNETTLAQIPYDPEQPAASAKILIPNELWRPGFNKLSLSVIQHYIDRCEDPTSPELWTDIDLHESVLSYTVEPIARPLQLRDLTGLFSPGIGGIHNILILNSPDADLSESDSSYLNQSLPLVAQSLALRRDYSPLTVRHARWFQTPNNALATRQFTTNGYFPGNMSPEAHVVMGTRDELATILPKTLIDKINGPFLQVDRVTTQAASSDVQHHQPGIRLIVSGITGADVVTASRALGHLDDSLNPLQHPELLKQEGQSARTTASGNYFLLPDSRYTFAELGRFSTTMKGAGTKRVIVNLPIRGNFYTHESATVDLSLDFAYGAGMGTGSVMTVLLNGQYVQGLKLNNDNGIAFRGYRISLPARMLHPGNNTLEFEFSMRAETVAGECRSVPASHLMVQMLDSSSITLPAASPVASQPDLATFSATAFPYIDATSRVRTELVTGSEDTLGEALSLAGKLAQLSHTMSDRLSVRTTIPTQLTDNAILLATPQEMPASLFIPVSDTIKRSRQWPYHILNLVKTVQASPSSNPNGLSAASLTSYGRLDNLGVLMAMRNPHSTTPAALTVITADSHSLLGQRIANLLSPQIWGQLKGELVVWDGLKDNVVSLQVGDYYEVGDKDRWHMLILTLSNNPWYMLAALLISIFGISLLARGYLRRREAKKLAE